MKYYEIINNNNKMGFFQEDDKTAVWIDSKDMLCSCPKIKANKKYIIMAKANTLIKQQQQSSQQEASYELSNSPADISNSTAIINDQKQQQQPNGILLDRDTFIVEWRPELVKRLRRFVKHYQNGKC